MAASPRAWAETIACDGLKLVNYASDPEGSLEDNHYIKGPLALAAIIARGANLAEIQINRSDKNVPILESLEVQTLASDFTAEDILPLHDNVPGKVKINAYADNSNTSEATGIIMLVNGKVWFGQPPPDKQFTVIQLSETTTAGVAHTWTALTDVSWPTDLPGGGKMIVLGMRAKSASGFAIRWIQGNRPGCFTQHAAMGPWMWFEEPFEIDLANKPQPELLSSTTTSDHTIELAVQIPDI